MQQQPEYAKSTKLVKSLVVIVIGYFVTAFFIFHIDHAFLFGGVFAFFLAILGISLLFFMLYKDLKSYKRLKSLTEFIPTFIGLGFVFYFCIRLWMLSHRDDSPVVMSYITEGNERGGTSIEFRKDGTYKLTDWFMGASYSRGKYTLKDSIIRLEESSRTGAKFLMRTETHIHDVDYGPIETTYVKYLYELDANGKIDKDYGLVLRDRLPD
jgi:hypothetical protein